MIDDSQRLRDNPLLLSLLSHYAQIGLEDRTTWRDRLMKMEGVEAKELSTLHGELIAFDWIEQNTGQAISRPDGSLGYCYRITLNGLREYRRFHGVEVEPESAETPERRKPNFARKKKQKSDSPDTTAIAPPDEPLVPAA